MTETPAFEIVALDGIEARLDAWCWAFAETERERIEAHWRELTARNPALFNGRVLLQHQSRMETTADGSRVLHARYFETDYAAFVARRALGRADGVRNGFANGGAAGKRRRLPARPDGTEHLQRRQGLFRRGHARSWRCDG